MSGGKKQRIYRRKSARPAVKIALYCNFTAATSTRDSSADNNEGNEGQIFIKIKNEGEKDFVVSKGDAIGQGIFMKYLLTDDDITENVRIGGIGSTNKEG